MCAHPYRWWLIVGVVHQWVVAVRGQEAVPDGGCAGAGAITLTVILTVFGTLLVLYAVFALWRRLRRRREESHLVLETDPERANDKFAFDNPGFKESILAVAPNEGHVAATPNKGKWKQWSPLSSLILTKNEKNKTVDDSFLHEAGQSKNVTLRSYDFTGLGFTICGNMRNGIFIKDILQRGPALESKQIFAGDRIKAMTIDFEHMVYEDAIAILSYASPYEVSLQMESRKASAAHLSGSSVKLEHPLYKSISTCDLTNPKKHREPPIGNGKVKPPKTATSSVHQVRNELERKLVDDAHKHENKYQKFGIKVLPVDFHDVHLQKPAQVSPKTSELSQNENNINLERHNQSDRASPTEEFVRGSSGIKRDKDGIPQEMPKYMMNAAVAARNNRKPSKDEEMIKSPKRLKGKAPAPPESKSPEAQDGDFVDAGPMQRSHMSQDYNSDSDNQSVNTIELNASHVTVHHVEENEERRNRRTHSTGDLMNNIRSNSSTLERAKSLDITDTGVQLPAMDVEEAGDVYGTGEFVPECQKGRLKKATEWGNLEDAIMNFKIGGFDSQESLHSELDDFHMQMEASRASTRNTSEELKAKDGRGASPVLHRTEELKDAVNVHVDSVEETRKVSPLYTTKELKATGTTRTSPLLDTTAELKDAVNLRVHSIEGASRTSPPTTTEEFRVMETTRTSPQLNSTGELNDEVNVHVDSVEETRRASPLNTTKELKAIGTTRTSPVLHRTTALKDAVNFHVHAMATASRTTPVTTAEEVEAMEARGASPVPYRTDELKDAVNFHVHSMEDTSLTSPVITIEEFKAIGASGASPQLDIEQTKDAVNTFLVAEKEATAQDVFYADTYKLLNTNVPDDMKVSRHSRIDIDEPTSLSSVKNISSVTIGESEANVTVNVNAELYTTAMEQTFQIADEEMPDIDEPTSLTIDINSFSPPTYVTEIKVVTPDTSGDNKNLDQDFDNYVRKFETMEDEISVQKPEAERELYKIQEIVEEQYKKLPEMKFSTSYESLVAGRDKPQSHIEQLRNNFEKPRVQKVEIAGIKSRIPVATTGKTPPTSPERRDSKNLDLEVNREIVAMMNAVMHSTPKAPPPKVPQKNVSITPIRSNSKIPSSIPFRLRKAEGNGEMNGNGTSAEGSFKQWVFAAENGAKQEL